MKRMSTSHRVMTKRNLILLAFLACLAWFVPNVLVAASTITYVQGNDAVPQTAQTSVAITYTAAQTAGDLNVVVVGWNNSTATVASVTDTSNNTYTLAVGPTVQSGTASQSIYYAKNIASAAAGANVVTVKFASSAAAPDIRILEYSGADPNNPVDVTAAATGSSASSNSGSATTTNATDLIFGANLVQTVTTAAGSGFTKRLLTSPDGDIAEDKMVTATGSYNATATVTSGKWIMQMVAFRTPSGGTSTPTVTNVAPNTGSTSGGTAVTITGTNFASGATVSFGGTPATNVTVSNSTTITATTPAGNAGAVTVSVTVNSLTGNLANGFTYVASPTVTKVTPAAGPAAGGTAVTITGTNFASGATVNFGGTPATNVTVSNSTTITATTPAGTPGAVTVSVTVNSLTGSLATGFTYTTTPTVTSVTPNQGITAGGTAVTISGSNFATGATVMFGTAAATNVVVVNSTTITASTPPGSAGPVAVSVTNTGSPAGSLANAFTYVAATSISYVQSNSATPQSPQTSVTITFTGAQAAGDLNVVVVGWNDSTATVASVTDSSKNTYALAVGPTILSGVASQSVYYAKNIAAAGAGTNVVTVTFSAAAAYPDIRILEYNGADPNTPVDVTAGATGNSATSSSGSATTSNASDLLFGANLVQTVTTAPGTGFTTRVLTTPDGDIAEDEKVTAAGSYSATATVVSGQWIMQMVAFRAASSTDTTPPTAPSNLSAVASGTQVSLTWTASTDNVGVTGYLVERCLTASCTFAQIGTSTTTTYNDPGLAPNTGYSYRVRATDAAGNLSAYSNTAATTTGAGGTPTAPSNLTALDGGPGPIVLAVQNYDNTNSLTSHTTAPFTSTGGDLIVIEASSHDGVTFTPTDSFGNTYISIAGPTSTTTGFDLRTQIWYVPNPVVGANHTITMGLSIAQPLVMSIFVLKGSDILSPLDGISPINSDNGTQSVSVISPTITTTVANDLLIGFVKVSAGATFSSGPGFTQQPAASSAFIDAQTGPAAVAANYDATWTISAQQTWQSSLVAVANSPRQTSLSWTASTETSGIISEYLVERCSGSGCSTFTQIGTSTTTTYNDTGLTASTSYSYRVRAEDTNGIIGPYSGVVTVVTPSPRPTAPSNLSVQADRQGPLLLTWTASTSSLGIADYIVERCLSAGCTNFLEVGTATGTSYTDSNVVASTTYSYMVQAVDNGGNVSSFSSVATGTTVGNQPPTAPSNLTATAVGTTQINLSWTASTSSIGLANYVVERCQGAGCTTFAQIGTPTGTTYSDTNLTPGTSYSYEVEAIDIAGNLSPFSNVATTSTGSSGSTTITYVQGAYSTPQSPEATVTVAFPAAQTAGDLNVVVVGWNDSTSTISGVTDTAGNTYTLAVGPTVQSGTATQSIYYAKNIAGATTDSVTVTFSAAAAYPDIRILEYKGADPSNPVDVTAAASGNSAAANSGSVTTSNATDLIFGADLVQTTTTASGAGFISRLLSSPDGDIAEDEMVAAVGSYSSSAVLNTGQWIMQMVAFRSSGTCGGGLPTTPTNVTATAESSTQINLSWTASTACLGIAHYTVQRCQGASCTNFATVGTPNSTTFSDTGLAASTSYSYQVEAVDNGGNDSAFSTVVSATTSAISISPRTATLTYTRTQQFTSSGTGTLTWSVDGVVGGSSTTGTITTLGLYTPPSTGGTHTVTVTNSTSNSASATVYITNYPGTYTYHNDNLRTGQNLSETVLTLNNVNQNQFGKLFSYALDGIAFASPLYVANVSIPGQGYHNVVYVATENDSVYAFDADGLSTTPLWQVSFLKSGVTTIPCADTGECGDIPTQIGITSTPVIDPSSGTIYVVAATKEGTSTWVQRLHALDITTGAEKFGGPVALQATLPGTGTGSSGGNLAFDPLRENQRSGLLLNNGVIYIAFGSHGDNSPWHGWVLGYNATTLAQTMTYDVTPNGNGGGIWQGGGGLATDTSGDIFYVTSNGDFDVNTGGVDYGDTIQKLSPTGSVVDYFTPHDQANMSSNNLDLGAGGPVMLVDQTSGPYPHLLISAGKNGTIYVINRDNMGHYNASNDNQIVQSLPGVLPNGNFQLGNFSVPVYFNGYVYFGAINDYVKAFQLTNGVLSTSPTSETPQIYEVRGSSFAISANNTSNGILWALQNNGTSADNDVGSPGILYAYNANNLATELYDTSQAGTRDTLDLATKFAVPLVANGKVYVAGQTLLNVYGLLP